jgi:predicted RNase H-like HicB family nuclease
MNFDPNAYNITVRRAEIEGEVYFEARVRELPDVVEYAESPEEAYVLAVDTIGTTFEILKGKGRVMPPPQAPADDYSGRVTLRLPRSLHRAVTEAADQEGVSLNQHLVNILGYYSGFAAGREADSLPWKTIQAQDKHGHHGKPNLRVVSSSPIEKRVANWR